MKSTVFFLALLCSSAIVADTLLTVDAEDAGFSSERLENMSAFTRREIEAGKIAGAVTMVARHGKIVHFDAVGNYGVDNDRAMEKDTLFRIYSMTKPITTVAMMMLYEEGMFELGDPVSKILPEFANQTIYKDGKIVPTQSEMTIEQLMSHSAGLTYGFENDHAVETAYQEAKIWESQDLMDFVGRVANIPLRFEPGTRYHYSIATDVLGAMVERLSGQTLERFFTNRIFSPLGMDDTFFNIPEEKQLRLASNHYWNAAEGQLTVVPTETDLFTQEVTLFSGSGGLFSTAMDYMIFCEMMRNGGSYDGVRILGPKTVQYMTINHLTDQVRNNGASEYPSSHLYPGQSFGLGFGVITDPGQSQVISSTGAYSWGGAANTKFWIDPEEDLVAILMSQVMGSPWSDHKRYQMKVATYQALTELGDE